MTQEDLKTIVGEVVAELQRSGKEIGDTPVQNSLAGVGYLLGMNGDAMVRVSPGTVNAGVAELQQQILDIDRRTVKIVKINGVEKTPEEDGVVDLGSISGGGGGTVDDNIIAQVATNTSNIAKNTSDIERLMKKNFPLSVSFSLTTPTGLQAYGTTVNTVTAKWSIEGADVEVLGLEIKLENSDEWIDVTDKTSHTFTDTRITDKTKVYFFADISGEDAINKEATINFAYRAYMGVVNDGWEMNEANIKKLPELSLSTSKSRDYTTSLPLENQKIVYAYAQEYRAITSIKDGNNLDVTESFEQKTVSIGGVPYYVYISKDATTTTTKVTVKFS